jgi:hypothetical protein
MKRKKSKENDNKDEEQTKKKKYKLSHDYIIISRNTMNDDIFYWKFKTSNTEHASKIIEELDRSYNENIQDHIRLFQAVVGCNFDKNGFMYKRYDEYGDLQHTKEEVSEDEELLCETFDFHPNFAINNCGTWKMIKDKNINKHKTALIPRFYYIR